MLFGPITVDVPASLLRLHPNVTVMMDLAAAGDILNNLRNPSKEGIEAA